MTNIRGSSTARFSPPADELHLPGAGKVTHFGQGVLRSPVMPMVKKTDHMAFHVPKVSAS